MKVIAHRGASKEAPENTIAAFERALECGADMLECDVHLTKDGEVVVAHDPILPFDTRGRCIADMEFEEIQKLDAGRWFDKKFAGQKVPLLKEVISLAGTVPIMVEMKKGEKREDAFVKAVLDLASNQYIGSFDPTYVHKLIDAGAKAVGICHSLNEALRSFPIMPKTIALSYEGSWKDVVATYHESDIAVWTWTVDTVKCVNECIAAGVDGIITNDPRLVRGLV